MLRAKYNYFQNFKSRECVMKLNLKTTGLVLEGGGMRGVFTSGVLDAFMKHDVHSLIRWLYRLGHVMACRI